MTKLDLPHFREALKQHKDAIPEETLRRYLHGELPKAVRLIVLRPDLAEALLADARALRSSTASDVTA